MKRLLFILCIALLIVCVSVITPQSALAHEHRTIADKYDVVVGWDVEPAYVNQKNAAAIRVHKAGTEEPVEGLEKTLRVKIAFGGNEPKEFPLDSVFGQPGYYVAHIIPTGIGDYVFTFVGSIEDTPVNEVFESGPGRFDGINDTAELIFPATANASSEVLTLRDELTTTRTLAIAGLVVGVIGALIGLGGLLTRARK
jgi:hypothetical protein